MDKAALAAHVRDFPEALLRERAAYFGVTNAVIEAGLATWGSEGRAGSLILRGQGRLLADVDQLEKLGAIQALFERLETEETMLESLSFNLTHSLNS